MFKIVNLSIYRNYISFVLLIVVYNITYNLMFGTELHKNVMLQSNCTEVYCSLELLWNTIFTHSFLIEHLVYKLLTMYQIFHKFHHTCLAWKCSKITAFCHRLSDDIYDISDDDHLSPQRFFCNDYNFSCSNS